MENGTIKETLSDFINSDLKSAFKLSTFGDISMFYLINHLIPFILDYKWSQ